MKKRPYKMIRAYDENDNEIEAYYTNEEKLKGHASEKYYMVDGERTDNPNFELAKSEEYRNNKNKKVVEDNRIEGYGELSDQLDVLWHDIDSGCFGESAKTSNFYKNIKSVKERFPSPPYGGLGRRKIKPN